MNLRIQDLKKNIDFGDPGTLHKCSGGHMNHWDVNPVYTLVIQLVLSGYMSYYPNVLYMQ